MLNNVLLQNIIEHAKRLAPRIELFLLKIVAIVAIQITVWADWLGEDLKLTRSSSQISVFL